MDWTAFTTILATGVVTLSGVWLKGRYDEKVERARMLAQRQDSIDARARDDAQAIEDRASQREAAKIQSANEALQTLFTVLQGMSRLSDTASAQEVDTFWNAEFDAQARQAVELLYDESIREDMGVVLDALADFVPYAEANELDDYAGWKAKNLVRLLVQLAGCVSRGEDVSAVVREHVKVVRARQAKVDDEFGAPDR